MGDLNKGNRVLFLIHYLYYAYLNISKHKSKEDYQ